MKTQPPISLSLADERDRERIYAIRHQVYARELGQHAENDEGRLTDALDAVNAYLVAKVAGNVAGFVSITPPTAIGYSIDKYFTREDVPLVFDQGLYEVRLLTVTMARRSSRVAALLMYGAWRDVESLGGRAIVCIGRLEMLDMYKRVGLRSLGRRALRPRDLQADGWRDARGSRHLPAHGRGPGTARRLASPGRAFSSRRYVLPRRRIFRRHRR